MKKFGIIKWTDLTVENAEAVKDFYCEVIGWTASELSMGAYSDYLIAPATNEDPIAGVCHQKGTNADLPSQWLLYVTVENLDKSLEKCTALAGKIIQSPKKSMNNSRFAVIQDPGGAYMALYEE